MDTSCRNDIARVARILWSIPLIRQTILSLRHSAILHEYSSVKVNEPIPQPVRNLFKKKNQLPRANCS